MKRIEYEYLGLKLILEKSTYIFDGKEYVIDEPYYEPCWYKGSETVPDNQAKKRADDLNQITDDSGYCKYRNIRILNIE